MPKTKTKKAKKPKVSHGLHLYRTKLTERDKRRGLKYRWYWNLIAKNGRELARSSETYNSKAAAVRSIMSTAMYFEMNQHYFDHTTRASENLGTPDIIVFELKD